ncbi:MAG: tetratricopeptide repeat protein [Alphaproteobacteria bacterium]|jgi:tetratricopeptide (TPR) repeat protein|nr:tetratricopeptide repeat protein [Alphaproteobacteria bacterium]
MATDRNSFKHIVAALVLAVGFSTPCAAQSDRLDRLFEDLKGADTEQAARLEDQIRTEWSKSGSPAMDLLLRRGEEALEAGEPQVAAEHLTALIDHAPDFAEGYHARASAYFALGLYGPALDDLRQALVLNPRHFGALAGFAVILQELDRPQEALELYRRIEQISPNSPDLAQAMERLDVQLEGSSI